MAGAPNGERIAIARIAAGIGIAEARRMNKLLSVDLKAVTGGGLPSLYALPVIVAGAAVDNVVRGWGNQFSWQRQPAGGYENPR